MGLRLTSEQEALIVDLYRTGLSETEVARQAGFKVARSTVNLVLKRRGVPAHGERHGEATREFMPRRWGYSIWQAMIQRCSNPNTERWRLYGGRGISVCDRWKNSYSTFISDMGPRPSMLHSIDRIDVNGNYEPGNCRWATVEEQAKNKQNCIRINGKTVQEIAAKLGCPVMTVYGRISRGWSDDQIESPLVTPGVGCNVSGCEGKFLSRGMCSRHYQQYRKNSLGSGG